MKQEEVEIKAYLDKWNKAMTDADTETLSQLMADDMVFTHITGTKQTKKEWLEEIRTGSMRYYNIDTENLNISISGDRATLSCTSIITARIWGNHGTWRLNTSAALHKINNHWIRINVFDKP